MKRTQIIDLLSTIRVTWVSFFSVVMFVTLAVAVYLGIGWSGDALRECVENEFDANSMHDVEIQFPYGLTESDLDTLRALDGVSDVEAGQVAYKTMTFNDTSYAARIGSIGTRIDMLRVMSGTLPAANNEIAIEARWAKREKLSVGDTVHIRETEDGRLIKSDFVVTALVECPAYLSNTSSTWGASPISGGLDLLAWIPLSGFSSEAYKDGSTIVTMRFDSLRMNEELSDDYEAAAGIAGACVEALGAELAPARHQQLVDEAQAKIDEAQRAIDDANAQIAEGEQAISDGDAQIAEGEQKLASGEQQLSAAKSTYASEKQSGREKLDAARAELDAGWDEYNAKKAELDEGLATYAEAVAALDAEEAALDPADPEYEEKLLEVAIAREVLADTKSQLDAAATETEAGRQKLESSEQEYEAGEAEYAEKVSEGRREIASAESQLASGRSELEEGRATLGQKRSGLEEGKSQLAEKQAEFDAALEKLEDLRNAEYPWTVMTRASNGGQISVGTFIDVVGQLRVSMASLFVFVGLFVCYSAISRLVLERARQIGAKKALGMRPSEVSALFLMYAACAVALGALLGVASAILVVERIILPTLAASFYVDGVPWWSIPQALAFGMVELVLILLSTWVACRFILKHTAVD
ncbi:MAG: hypothetical protein K6F70_06575, partial [Eggerthellaceae bacterium]|nr:hypothetical protein [Eggerthellaceae bacterium]